MPPLDGSATAVGAFCVLFMLAACKGKIRDERLLFAFGNGASATYLVLFVVGIIFDFQWIKEAVMSSNSVLLIGSLAYTAYINVRAITAMVNSNQNGAAASTS